MSGEVVILTGPPGAGKTTVAALIASDASRPTVHLVTDEFYRAIRTGFVLPFLPEAQRQNEVVIDVIAGAVATYARGGYDVMVDGIIGPWFLAPFRSLDVPVSYVVLRPSLETTLARGMARGAGELTDASAITGMHEAFADLGPLERHVLDSGSLSTAETAVAVRRAVSAGAHRL
ncbi:AAA family ATPase [Lentzea sp. JNUCC 0626]|uniref:AAA family ATPase n=1 Tax=Lentzea sp. JNUCC 0626 TaxID=3367513 RepID=UPI003748E851